MMLYKNEINQLKEEIEYVSYLRYIMFTFNKSFINSNNELIISGGNVKGFSFMKYNYK